MNCIHCNEPGAHPGTRKCTDLQACHGRQEYARGVADERARVVADLVKSADRTSDDKMGPVKIVLLNAAIRFERCEHESEGA